MQFHSVSIAFIASVISVTPANSQASFAPLDAWKSAVAAGNKTALSKLYSANPEAMTKANNAQVALADECSFWAGLKAAGMTSFTPRLLEVVTEKGITRTQLRISIVSGGAHLMAAEELVWARQADGWKIVASQRSQLVAEAARVLPQPSVPNVSLYSDPAEAETELKEGLGRAVREKKRVIVVFGGNWCYDCHVLDTTFRSTQFAPLVDANFVVVHINIGDQGKDNNALAARLGVVLDKGVPSLGVLEPDGKVVYAQQNGEFESTVKIGPEDVRAFLEKWKPAR